MDNLPSAMLKSSSVRSFFLHRRIPDSSDLIILQKREELFGGVARAYGDYQWNPVSAE
jgi:hypothetical protein